MENIKVLWIDDESLNKDGELTMMGREFVECANDFGIDITPESSFKNGLNRILKNPLEFIAVILDVRNQRATVGEYADDYVKVRDEIKSLQKKLGQKEPYIFVMSGEKQYQTEGSPFLKEDYCSKRVYDKATNDYEKLFDDIIKIHNVSEIYKCQSQYSDILKITEAVFGHEAYSRLLWLTYSIFQQENSTDTSKFNDMRKFFESFIMCKLKEKEYSYFAQPDKDTMNELSRHINKDTKIPIYIKRAFHTVVNVIQDGSHSDIDKKNRLWVDKDVRKGSAPYLLRSTLFELFNIIVWLENWGNQ